MNEPNRDQREEVVDEFLRGGPRSEEWRQWRDALERRLAALKKTRSKLSGGDVKEIDRQIDEIENQIDALATEEIISEFVESEIDLSLNAVEPEDY